MEYRIEHKTAMRITGISRFFLYQDCYTKVPEFWSEVVKYKYAFGVCYHKSDTGMDYMIGNQGEGNGPDAVDLPDHYWAVFPCTVGTLQTVNTEIWESWAANHVVIGDYHLEVYYPDHAEIWVPTEDDC